MMRSLIIILIQGLMINVAFGQQKDTLRFEDVKPFVQYFTLDEENHFSAESELLMRSTLQNAQFVSIGEYHGIREISQLTIAFLELLNGEGFSHFAVEVGPCSADTLMAMNTKQIKEFYRNESIRTGDLPIPFFNGETDLEFLEAAKGLNYSLWGLDQEFIYSYAFIFDHIYNNIPDPSIEEKSSYERAIHRLEQLYKKKQESEELNFFEAVLEDEAISSFSSLMSKSNTENAKLIKEIRKSCSIYYNWRPDLNSNLRDRNELMRAHFIENYRDALKNEALPKVFVKMGGYHTMKGWSPNAQYEVGNLLNELAFTNGMNSVHFGFLVRYYQDDEAGGGIGDNLDYDSNWIKQLRPLLEAGQKDKWAMIELSGIKELWLNRVRYIPEQIKDRVKGFDYILIPPAVHEAVDHYGTE